MKYIAGTIDPLLEPKVNISFDMDFVTDVQEVLDQVDSKIDDLKHYDGGIEVGSIISVPASVYNGTLPVTYTQCNGSKIYKDTNPELFSKLKLGGKVFDYGPENGQPWLKQHWLKNNRSLLSGKNWEYVGQTLFDARYCGTVVTDHKLFLIGNHTDKIQKVSFIEDGSLNTWEQETAVLPDPTIDPEFPSQDTNSYFGNGTVRVKNYIYVIGGLKSSTIKRVSINTDGSITNNNWELYRDIGALFPTVANNHYITTFVIGNYLYLLQNKMYRALISDNGDIGEIVRYSAGDLPDDRNAIGIVITDDTIFFVGGQDKNGVPQVSIFQANINNNEFKNVFISDKMLPAAYVTYNSSCITIDDKVYLINQMDNKIYVSSIKIRDGKKLLSQFIYLMDTPFDCYAASFAIIGNFIYMFGNASSNRQVYRISLTGGLVDYLNFPTKDGYIENNNGTIRYFEKLPVMSNCIIKISKG